MKEKRKTNNKEGKNGNELLLEGKALKTNVIDTWWKQAKNDGIKFGVKTHWLGGSFFTFKKVRALTLVKVFTIIIIIKL